MNLLDSSVWIEYLAGGSRLSDPTLFAAPEEIVVSAINLFEVGRYVQRVNGEEAMIETTARMSRSRLVHVDREIAELAVGLASAHRLHAMDALIAATARREGATLVTLDADLLALPGARRP